jgi:hypothetical protein
MAFIPRNTRTTSYLRTEYHHNFDTVFAFSVIKAVKVIKHNKDIVETENDILATQTTLKSI